LSKCRDGDLDVAADCWEELMPNRLEPEASETRYVAYRVGLVLLAELAHDLRLIRHSLTKKR